MPDQEKRPPPERAYPPLYEKVIPIALVIIVLIILILLLLIVSVALGLSPGVG